MTTDNGLIFGAMVRGDNVALSAGAGLLPSLQTINVLPLLLPTFLSRVLVAYFPPDLLQNPLFKLVREMKHMGAQDEEEKGKRRENWVTEGWETQLAEVL